MKKVEKIYVYSNNVLYLTLVNRYEKIPLVVYEKEIDRFRIRDIRKSSYLEGVRAKLEKAEREVNKNFSEILKNTLPKLILTTESLEIRREQFEKTFDEKCEVNEEDIKRIIKKGMKELEAYVPENHQITEYKIINYIFDDKPVGNIIGQKVENIKLIVDILITDNSTLNELQSVFSLSNVILDGKYLLDYRLLRRLNKNQDAVLIDLNYEINKVFIKDGNLFYINYLNTGIGTILIKVFEYFKEMYGDKKAEEITRFVKKNWILNTFDYECDIIEEVDIKKVIKVTREVCLQYFNILFSKFKKFEKFYVVCDDMFEKELVKFLNLNFDFEIKQAFPNSLLISNVVDNKIGYCLNELYEEEV